MLLLSIALYHLTHCLLLQMTMINFWSGLPTLQTYLSSRDECSLCVAHFLLLVLVRPSALDIALTCDASLPTPSHICTNPHCPYTFVSLAFSCPPHPSPHFQRPVYGFHLPPYLPIPISSLHQQQLTTRICSSFPPCATIKQLSQRLRKSVVLVLVPLQISLRAHNRFFPGFLPSLRTCPCLKALQ